MTEPRRLAALIRNLVTERAEAVEQLLVLTQSYAPGLFEDAAKLAEEHREEKRTPARLFEDMRGLYGRVIDAFAESTKIAIADGRFDEALSACDGLTFGLDRRELRNEVFAQRGRFSDLRAKERQGVADERSRNSLRLNILATIDAIVDAAALPAVAPGGSYEPSEPQTQDRSPPPAQPERAVLGAESDIVIDCTDLGKRYRGSTLDALAGVNLRILRGRILGIVGLNGSGKSTLLSLLAGDLAPSAGKIDRGSLQRADIAFVPQKTEAWAGRLADHLGLYAAYYGHTGEKNKRLVERTLTILHLQAFSAHQYSELSAGYQMQCALARALVATPKVLILDEPLASLDPVAQYKFLAVLHANARYQLRLLPVILSSQHIDVVESFADDMLVIRDGRPIFCGPTAELGADREENVFEIRCPLPEHTLRQVLGPLEPRSIRPRADSDLTTAGGLYEVRLPVRATARDVLRTLQKGGVEPLYFADLSRSSLALLLKGTSP